MIQLFSCAHGHQWQTETDSSWEEVSAVPCPVCGAPGASTVSMNPLQAALSTRDDLPPPPKPMPGPASEIPTNVVGLPANASRAGPGVWAAVAGYEILGELGRGGMGVVYKARQLNLNRLVALKMLLSGPHSDPRELARFRIEAEAVAQMQHPNIVQIYDIGEQEGRLYCSLEFVDGGSLARKLAGQPLPAPEAA